MFSISLEIVKILMLKSNILILYSKICKKICYLYINLENDINFGILFKMMILMYWYYVMVILREILLLFIIL